MSPNPKSKSRSTSLTLSRVSTGDALRRGDLKISEPIPIPREANGYGPQALPQQNGEESWTRVQRPRTEELASSAPKHAHHGSDPRLSSYNTTASLSTNPSKTSLSKKRVGLRATIKRLFGANKKRDTITSIVEEPARREELSFITTADTSNVQRRAPRSSSMPIQDVTRHSALNSHAPDLFEPNENETDRRTLQRNSFDGTYYLKRRNSFGDSGIGAAQTLTDTQKRRSRSAGHLRALAAQFRNRDEEISYWRKSIIEAPVHSYSPSGLLTTEINQEPDRFGLDAADFGPDHDPSDRQPSDHYPFEPPQDSAFNSPRELHVMPSQTFDFGNLVNINSEDSVEQRLTTVEVKLMDLEMAISRLSGHDIAKHMVLDKPPQGRRLSLPPRSHVESIMSSESHDPTFLASPHSSPSVTDAPQHIGSMGDRMNRASAATTVRPATAVRNSMNEEQASERPPSYATIEHVEKLMILLQREQSSRHKLELQVKRMESQLDQLQRSPPYAHFKVSSYPTPSPEEGYDGTTPRTAPGNVSIPSHAGSGPASRFRDDISVATETDDGFADVYQTPTEIKEQKFSMENLLAQQPHMSGMI